MNELLLSNPQVNINAVIKASKESFPNNAVIADLCAAQAILESGLRTKPSKLALEGNNLFGIKGIGTKGSIFLPTEEFRNGQMHKVMAQFASNETLKDSFEQHKTLLNKPRYSKVLAASTFEEAATEVYKAGYATDPNYTKELMEVYNQHVKGK